MKIDTSSVKKWTILNNEWKLQKVSDISHTHMWRWGATYSFKVKDILTGASNTLTYKSGTTLEAAEVNYNNATYLYNTWDSYSFMESDTSEMHDLDADLIEDSIPYLKEWLDVFLIKYDWRILWVVLPTTIRYKVASTVPWIKWDRATTWKKPATLETGLEVQVALYVAEWDEVILNTLTGETS